MEAIEAQQRQMQQHGECFRRIKEKLEIAVPPKEPRVKEREENMPTQQYDEEQGKFKTVDNVVIG